MSQQLSILHLEDNPGDAELVRICLEENGINCHLDVVSSGPEFRLKVVDPAYGLILSDYSIPGFSGKEALSLAVTHSPETPFIFISGTIDERLALESLALGASDYILKNAPARLPSAVVRACENADIKKRMGDNSSAIAFHSELLSNFSEAVFVIDAEGKIVTWNHSADLLFENDGKSPLGLSVAEVDDLFGCRFFDLFLEHDLMIGEGCDLFCEFQVGTGKWVNVNRNAPIESRILGRLNVFVARDVSESRELATRTVRMASLLEQAVKSRTSELVGENAALRSFSYAASHDLRAPVRIILGYAQLLGEEFGESLSPDGRLYVNRIASACRRMDELMKGLLALANMDGQEIMCEIVDITSMGREIGGELIEQNQGRELAVEVQSGLSTFADTRLMRSLLENLIGNAVKYSASTQVTRVILGKSEAPDEGFFVRDNGAGFHLSSLKPSSNHLSGWMRIGEMGDTGSDLRLSNASFISTEGSFVPSPSRERAPHSISL